MVPATFQGLKSLMANAFMAGSVLCATPVVMGCGGKVPGDDRSYWLPATTISEHDLSERSVSVGTNQQLGSGFLPNSYYGNPSDIAQSTSSEQAYLFGMLFDELAETTMNFSHPQMTNMLANNVYLTMTDLNTWPNAYYGKGFAEAYRFQVLGSQQEVQSDCLQGTCRFQDVIVIKNRVLHPLSRDRSSLTPSDRTTLQEIAEWFSEELNHDYLQSLDPAVQQAFFQTVGSLWAAGSVNMTQDSVFGEAWLHGGIAFAISDTGIKNYALRGSLQAAIAEAYPGASAAEQFDREVALISWLQLMGESASAFIGQPGRSYVNLYMQEDANAGKPLGNYDSYRNRYIERESFSHMIGRSTLRTIYPSFLRRGLDGPYQKDFLDQKFHDGFTADPRIQNNPYLSDGGALRDLVANVIPLVLAKEGI